MRTASIASSRITGAMWTTNSSVSRAQKAGWECALKSVGMDAKKGGKKLMEKETETALIFADKETSNEPTNAEVLADGLNDFALKEDFTQEEIVDYISCPGTSPCDYDGGSNHDCCTRCKVKWLLSKWED